MEITRLQGVYSKPERDTIVFSFECHILSGELTTTDEADEHRFVVLEDIPQNFSPRQTERLGDSVSRPDEVVLKTQKYR